LGVYELDQMDLKLFTRDLKQNETNPTISYFPTKNKSRGMKY